MNKCMTINGLSVLVNLPDAPAGNDDVVHTLPPYHAVEVHKVSDYKCPDNWMHGSGNAESYFIKVEAGKHLWLDFNDLWTHTHEVAVVLSVQGINPVTNKPISKLRLEQHREKCPEHKVDFEAERYCPKCDHKWPAQNYMTTTSMPRGAFWVDGWHIGGGKIRGFLITEEAMRGVASQLIGEKRVYAIGIAFYVSKNPKPPRPERPSPLRGTCGVKSLFGHIGTNQLWCPPVSGKTFMNNEPNYKVEPTATYGLAQNQAQYSCNNIAKLSDSQGATMMSFSGDDTTRDFCSDESGSGRSLKPVRNKSAGRQSSAKVLLASAKPAVAMKAEIAAGAQISQNLDYIDHSDLDFYSAKPAGMLYLNYTLPVEFDNIIANPKKKRKEKDALSGLKVGNP